MSRRKNILGLSRKQQEKWTTIIVLGIFAADYLYTIHFLYPVIAGIVAIVILYFLVQCYLKKIKKDYRATLEKIDQMTGVEFENYLAGYFTSQGYRTKLTPVTNDYGADLVLKKNNIKYVVQAKRYSYTVGKSAVQEVVAAKSYYQAEKAIVITSNYFTRGAIILARSNNVELWDRDKVRDLNSKWASKST